MLSAINARVAAQDVAEEVVGEEGEKEEFDVLRGLDGAWVKLPEKNKQERKFREVTRREDAERQAEAGKEQVEGARDWARGVLVHLEKHREYVEGYGLGEIFFRASIARLREIKGLEVGEG